MTVATFNQTNFTTQDATTYKSALDGNTSVMSRIAASFAPSQQSTPNMTVLISAGANFIGGTITPVAAQSTGTITAPVSNPRIDRVLIDMISGAVSVVTGTENASPVAPAIPAGKLPVAQILLQTTSTAIQNSMITDERAPLILSETKVIESFVPVSAVVVASTFTSPAISNNAGNTQLTSAGVHGLTAGVAVGKNVYISWAGGTGVSSLYPILSVDSTTAFTINLPYASGLGTPTVTLAGNDVPLGSFTIPANSMGSNGSVEVLPIYTYAPATTETGTSEFRVNGSYLDTNGIGGSNALAKRFIIANRGAANSNMYVFDTGYVASGKAFDTTADMTIGLSGYSSTANGVVTLEGYLATIRYHR